jgi:hypothetical protein
MALGRDQLGMQEQNERPTAGVDNKRVNGRASE